VLGAVVVRLEYVAWEILLGLCEGDGVNVAIRRLVLSDSLDGW
jgi:hypothetical protein